ncbi:MAG: ABC transporter ATP-binding protein [Gammaproteobacteria bacterium]|jgi:simple sugar transport system ATP-binding protein|nr:ABC transporter ATP-binding protein [Gammaproteobacteria bacterium]MBT3722101.1 ABC transporter ATP-binding protein [Gammaproteobacteria bacterium]MBT4194995.1 ABC transporter ATP-binding protein [Gammaproteobacteria bacterium]MBT4449563.1 ABC transporter ATP-binding protein [Gammaproteobacteria bacterium]MBT4860572.1 ABC transporter ATP-binding protein [Gammaproteobacteria bacterium]
MNTSPPYLLELKGMRKAFPGVLATDNVDLKIKPGEVHALLGENGAGKSTLVKMIYGILKADAGSIHFNGEQVEINTPARARELGVAMVFQHFSLFDSLSVVENISLGMDHGADMDELAHEITDLSNRYGLPLDPQRHVYTLSVGERQRIEIIRCLLQKPKLLVMDEPTSVLTPQEVEKLFITLKRLSEEGMAILYISHKLNEIKALCSNATILRLGKKVDSVKVEEESTQSLAAMMMGKELKDIQHPEKSELGEVRLSLKGLDMPAKDKTGISLKAMNLDVYAGEVVGISGVAGNGQDELLAALNGEQRCVQASSIEIEGKAAGRMSPNERRLTGLASVPEKRLGHGAVPDMDLVENAFLTAFKRLGLIKSGLIDKMQTTHFAEKIIQGFSVKTPGSDVPAASLSGGNLQKFIIGRELLQNPDILIVAQPTWGVDAGAAQTIRQELRELAAKGAAVLVISQDLDELLEISDRIGAICGGRLSKFYQTSEITTEQVGMLMAGVCLEEGVLNVA